MINMKIAMNECTQMIIGDEVTSVKGCFADTYIPGHISVGYSNSYWGNSDTDSYDFIGIETYRDDEYKYYCCAINEGVVEVKCFTEEDYNYICEEYGVTPITIKFS